MSVELSHKRYQIFIKTKDGKRTAVEPDSFFPVYDDAQRATVKLLEEKPELGELVVMEV